MDNKELMNVEPEMKEPKSAKQITLLVLKIVGNVLFYSVIVMLFIFSLMNINAGQKNGIPNIFGNGYLRVLSNSMYAEADKLPEEYKDYKIKQFRAAETEEVEGKLKYTYKGDVVTVSMIGKSGFAKLKVGDVVTYWDATFKFDDGKTADGAYVTHRIICVHKDDKNKTQIIYTVGDKAVAERADVRETIEALRRDVEIFYSDDSTAEEKQTAASNIYDYEQKDYLNTFSIENYKSVKAKVTGVNYKAGYTIIWIQQYWLIIFVIPLAIIMAVEIALVVRNIILLRREKNKSLALADHDAQMADLQSEKERMRAELLAELRSQGVITETPAEEAKEEAPKEEQPQVAPVVEEKEAPKVEEANEEVAEEPKDKAVVEEVKEEQPVEEAVETAPETEEVKEDAPMEQVEEDSTEAIKEEEPVIENEKADEPNMSIEENEPEEAPKPKKAPAKKTTTAAKKTTTAKKTSTTKTKKETEK